MTVFDIYGLVSNDSILPLSKSRNWNIRKIVEGFFYHETLSCSSRSISYHLDSDSALDRIEMQYKRGWHCAEITLRKQTLSKWMTQ